ncbi:GntR family transcriptional regulator [Acidisoma cellulosilytica]|uniref:GntR family transcriptional regulator n=1 Tax=Acidisoma cellulosilyticum TaxID=2802395 RepID=A0A963Z3B4_9PROT|nr:GntR family transcriptional regulator [Acidisoma cellulosilyticum]MCB8881989.1 GntR family transcriptional regulator [Acidisoma cellulosilyticum]
MAPALSDPEPTRKPDSGARPRRAPIRAGDGPDKVYAAIRRDIIERRLPAGTKLPEGDIAQRFGVSRTVIRAAFGRLIAEGLVVRPSNQNARVAKPSPDEAADILDLRRSIELIVIGRLTDGTLPEETLATLRAHVAEEERALNDGGAESIRLSGEFHVRLAEAAGSPLLARYVAELVSRCSLLLSDQHLPHSGQCAVQEHQALIDSLARGDGPATLNQMAQHLTAVGERAELPTSGRRALTCQTVTGQS